jgi:uncharacterized protein
MGKNTVARVRRTAVKMLSIAALAIVAVVLLQRHLIYYPRKLDPANYREEVRQAFGKQARILAPFDAVVLEPKVGIPVVGTAVVFHGCAELGIDRTQSVTSTFINRGLRMVLAEYPGYGPREGEASETTIVDDALALYERVRALYPGQPVILVGVSLGSGVAVQVAARLKESEAPARLVLLTPYLSLSKTAARFLPFLPTRYLVWDRFDSEHTLPAYSGPVAIAIAGQDRVIGAEQGEVLAQIALARGRTDVVKFPKAGHLDWPYQATVADWSKLLGAEVQKMAKAAYRQRPLQ